MLIKSRYVLFGIFVLVIIVAVLVVALQGNQQQADTYTVGIVNIASILNPVVDGFKEEMVSFGYIEEENITYLYDGPVSRDDHEAKLQEYIDQEVDLILTLTTPVTVTAKALTADTKIPVVFVPVTDPITAGIVTELAHPGENITGIISGMNEPKRLEWLLEIAPETKRVLYPYNPNDSSPVNTLAELNEVIEDLEVELVSLEVADTEAVQAVIDNIPEDIDAIFLPPDSLVGSLYSQWAKAAITHELPISGSSLAHVEEGILCSYSYSPFEAGKRTAHLVDQILKGSNPGDLPIEVTEPLSSLNFQTLIAMGFDVSDTVLGKAQVLIRDNAKSS